MGKHLYRLRMTKKDYIRMYVCEVAGALADWHNLEKFNKIVRKLYRKPGKDRLYWRDKYLNCVHNAFKGQTYRLGFSLSAHELKESRQYARNQVYGVHKDGRI